MTKILLVEDDKSLREIYGVRLLAEGYDIVSAGDGEEALAMAIKERPQLIVSDVMMPKISGFDMLDILRSTTETKDIKVIMMTALSSEDQRVRGEQLGADRYLVKSQVGIEDVVRTVHEVLGDAPTNNASDSNIFSNPAPRPSSLSPNIPPARQGSVAAPSQQQPAAPNPQPSYEQSTPASPPLPQPTAPFSSPRPANLGDRIIHPLGASDAGSKPDVAALMDQELQQAPQAVQPAQQNGNLYPAGEPQSQPAQPHSMPEQLQPAQNFQNPVMPPPPPSNPSPEFMPPENTPHGAVNYNPQNPPQQQPPRQFNQ